MQTDAQAVLQRIASEEGGYLLSDHMRKALDAERRVRMKDS